MPDLACPFVRDHARADRRVRHALIVEEPAIDGGADAGHDVAADALIRELRRREIPQRAKVDGKAFARVPLREFITQPEIAVRHVRDAAPASAAGTEDFPELLLCGEVAFFRDAAREGVDLLALAVAHERHELDETGEDVERLESG